MIIDFFSSIYIVNEKVLFERFEETISNIIELIIIARSKNLSVTDNDLTYITLLKEHLIKICPQYNSAKDMLLELLTLLSDFKVLPKKEAASGPALDSLDSVLIHSYGSKGVDYWLKKIKQRLYMEIDEMDFYKSNKLDYSNFPYKGHMINEELFNQIVKDLIGAYNSKQIQLKPYQFKKLPSVYNYVTNEGFYLGNPSRSTLYVSDRIFKKKKVLSRDHVAYLYIFLAHEIFPGHHYQYSSIRNPFIYMNYDLLQNPLSLEGFAILGEQHAKSLNFHYQVCLYNLKKLIPTAIYLESLVFGRTHGEKLIKEIFKNKELLNLYQKSGGFGSPNIVYTVGYLECLDLLERKYNFDNGLGAITYWNFNKTNCQAKCDSSSEKDS